MSHAVLALGVVIVTVCGCVWYLPAIAAVRAGADRPPSHRIFAAASLSGWLAFLLLAPVLVLDGGRWTMLGVGVAGGVVTGGLAVRGAAQRRREVRQAAREWAQLRAVSQPPARGRRRRALVVGGGLLGGSVLAGVSAVTRPEAAGALLVGAVAAAAVVCLWLAVAAGPDWGRSGTSGGMRAAPRAGRRLPHR